MNLILIYFKFVIVKNQDIKGVSQNTLNKNQKYRNIKITIKLLYKILNVNIV